MKDLVIGMGEVLFDCFPSGERKLGGAPANFVYHASQFGLRGFVLSAVGRDALGDEALLELAGKQLQTSCIARVDAPTGTVKVTLDEKGDSSYEISLGSAWDNIPLTAEAMELARSCRAVCLGSLSQRSEVSRRTIQTFLDVVSQRDDCLVVFDVNLRQNFYDRQLLELTLGKSDILKINDQEFIVLRRLLEKEDLDEADFAAFLIREFSLEMVILTLGSQGSTIFLSTGERFHEDGIRVDVKSTVGAGDAFTGAFVAALLRGRDVASCQRLATRAAAWVCSFEGAMPRLPEEIIQDAL